MALSCFLLENAGHDLRGGILASERVSDSIGDSELRGLEERGSPTYRPDPGDRGQAPSPRWAPVLFCTVSAEPGDPPDVPGMQ